MTDYAKPSVRAPWASTANTPADIIDPGASFQSAGWPQSLTPPERQYFNWLLNRLDAGLRYFLQRGGVDYDAAENYRVGSIVIGPDGLLYASLVGANINHTPASSPTQWGSLNVQTPATGDNTTKIATTAWARLNFLVKSNNLSDITSPVTARSNLGLAAVAASGNCADLTGTLANARMVLANVAQFQASLVIAGANVTGTVANATNAANAAHATTATTATSADSAAEAASATKLDTAGGAAPCYAARAWACFNAAGSGYSAGGNIASVTHFGTGRWIVNFATAMPNAGYAVVGAAMQAAGNFSCMFYQDVTLPAPTTTSCYVSVDNQNGNVMDSPRVNVAFFD